MSKKIGFFGGTFDPIHFGHIHLALQMLEIHHLECVLFCPAFQSPLKADRLPQVSAEHRLNMVKLAIEPIKNFLLLDYEVESKKNSYTIDTIRYLKKEGKDVRLILGEDSLADLASWKEVQELLSQAPPFIGSRLVSMPSSIPSFLQEKIKPGITKIPVLEISSTDIRERLRKRLYCGHLLPAKVLDYIYENGLY
jgi:nicotinate-nucleotide adenylyltransferase